MITLFLYLEILDPCFAKDTDYYGNDINWIGFIDSAASCQIKCQKTEDCKAFVYWPAQKRCHFKNKSLAKKDEKYHKSFISGPRNCSKFR